VVDQPDTVVEPTACADNPRNPPSIKPSITTSSNRTPLPVADWRVNGLR